MLPLLEVEGVEVFGEDEVALADGGRGEGTARGRNRRVALRHRRGSAQRN